MTQHNTRPAVPSGPVAGLINGITFRPCRIKSGYVVEWFGTRVGETYRDSFGRWFALDAYGDPLTPNVGFAPHYPTRRDAANSLARHYGVNA